MLENEVINSFPDPLRCKSSKTKKCLSQGSDYTSPTLKYYHPQRQIPTLDKHQLENTDGLITLTSQSRKAL